MDGLKPQQGRHRGSRSHTRPASHVPALTSGRHTGERYWLVRSLGKVASKQRKTLWKKFRQTEFAKWPDRTIWNRLYAIAMAVLVLITTLAATVQPFLNDAFYGVTEATRAVLPQPKESLGTFLTLNEKEAKFIYNEGYTGSSSDQLSKTGQGDPRITATFSKEAGKGMTVSDPINKIDFKMTPKFKLNIGKQDKNQLFYPLTKQAGYLVLTAQTASIKEDIVLEKATDDRQEFSYDLDLGDGLEARLEDNGSVGVYGSSLPINGNVATGSDKDAELLQKVRESAKKDQLLFVIPKPVVVESGKEKGETVVRSWFELKDGRQLTLVSENLKSASYPLSIDPSVYVQSAAQLMRGNNESNVEFDIATEQFKKGTTTGARIDAWTDTTDMGSSVWDQGMAAAGGYVYRAGGRTSSIKPEVIDKKVSAQSTASGTFTMNMPDTRPAGDLYIAIIAHHNSAATINTPAGWTNYNNANEHAAFYKIGTDQGGGNEQAAYNFAISTGTQQFSGVMIRVRNFSSVGTSASSNATSGAPSYPAITASNPNTLLIRGSGFDDDIPPASGYSPAGHLDIASGYSNGTTASTSGAGFTASELTATPLSGSSTSAAAITGVDDSYGASSLIINGITVTNAMNASVEWAHFNSTDGSIDSPAPGSNETACSGWCTNSAYNLPSGAGTGSGAGRVGMQMIAYNGYLYVIGGFDGTNVKSTVYVAKLGAKGEPSLWHPSDPNQANWVYWYKNPIDLPSTLTYTAAYAYNGKMYLTGGDTNTSANSGATDAVRIADILPNGELGSWSSGPNLPAARYGAAVQGYNGYLYVLGGNNNGTMLSTVHYSRINSDGTLNTWQTANLDGITGFSGARSSHGGLMAGIWGAYIYIAGGCATVNGSGYCSSLQGDVQLASINADGTLDNWNSIRNLDNRRFGYSFIAWQDSLYRFGGCGWQDQSTGECYATHRKVQYGNINQDGDASTVSITTPSGQGLCQGDDPYDCDLPPLGDGAGQGGQMLSSTAILNGYLYVIGGCADSDATRDCSGGAGASGNVSYAAISSDGKLKSPPSCSYTVYGSWCVDDTNQVNGTAGIAASGMAVFGGYIYVVGGLNGSANVGNVWRNTTNRDGSLVGGWTAQTFANLAITTNVSYTFAYARANPSSSTYVGNLYIFGGCGASNSVGCTQYQPEVYKCNILASGALEESNTNDCWSTGDADGRPDQLQIDAEAAGGNQGLGIHAGTVYANYIYLVGGVSPGQVDRKTILYAKFDNNNNVVAASGSAWTQSPVEMRTGRRRGTAFGYNGYLYAVGGYEQVVDAPLDTIEFAKINVSNGSLVASDNLFTQSAVTINQRWGLALAVSNSFAYIIGGCNVGAAPGECSSLDSTVQTFQVYNNDSGAPGGYSTSANQYSTNTSRIGASAAVLNGILYIAGGCTSATDCTGSTNNVQYTPIDAHGNLSTTWTNATGSLGGNRAYGELEVAGGSLYYIGGQTGADSTAQTTVYYGTPSVGGDVSSWTPTTALPAARTQVSATVWNNRIYVTGGTADGATMQTTVYVSPQLNSGGAIPGSPGWTTTTSFNVARGGHVVMAYANNLYVLGGYTGSLYLSDVQFTQINSDGTLDSWTYSTNLPTPLRQADGFAVNGYMYIFGGRSSTNDCSTRTLIAPISANTTIASGNNPTGIGEWYETNRKFDGGRYGAAAAYHQGRAYVMGGGCQGVVMQDDFDPGLDAGEWTSTTNMSVGTTCQSTSDSNVLSASTGGTGGGVAITKDMNLTSGGTIYFKLYAPTADTSGCFAREADFLLGGNPEHILLQYSVNAGGAWTTIGQYNYNVNYSPMQRLAVTVPAAGANTRFRWHIQNGEANDGFGIEDVYVIANNSTTLSYPVSTRVQQTSLLSQPQIAHYSRLIDAGQDVFPTNFLLNGLDNSIGARWQVSYRAMNDSTVTDTNKACGGSVMPGYGQLTNFGDVTLGKPERYYAKNSGGTNIGCSRYYFVHISIDASKTYGYPDDISRGPTLDNFLVFFQSNPGQRMLHGKTFVDGGQQPLDTPCRQSGGANNSGCVLP